MLVTNQKDGHDSGHAWKPILEAYNINEIVQMDEDGCLIKAQSKASAQLVHIKYLKNLKGSAERLKDLTRELLIMHELTHMPENNFTVKLHQIYIPTQPQYYFEPDCLNELFIIYDCVDLSLQQLLDRQSQSHFSETHLLCLSYNILCCLNFLESANILHRNLQPNNILIDLQCQPLISDFSKSRSQPKHHLDYPKVKPRRSSMRYQGSSTDSDLHVYMN